MRKVSRIVLTLVCVALLASPALAQRQGKGKGQGRGGFGGGFGGAGLLLMNAGVQKELKLSEDQIGKIKEANTKVREKYQDEFAKLRDLDQSERFAKMREVGQKMQADTKKEMAGILNPEQEKRLKQIELQQQGIRAFQEADVQKALKLTDEQKDNLKTINDDAIKDLRELFQPGAGNFQENAKKREAIQKEAMDKALAQLNETQKKEWKEMTGAPFKVEFNFGGGRGGKRKKQ